MAGSRQQQKEITSRRMILAALGEFSEKGYTNATISSIASRAGVAAGLVSQRFGNKEELLCDVIRYAFSAYCSRKDIPGDINGILLDLVRIVKSDEYDAASFVSLISASHDLPESAFACARECFEASFLASAFSRAQRNGVRPSGRSFDNFFLFISVCASITSGCRICGRELPSDEDYVRHLIYGNINRQEGLTLSENNEDSGFPEKSLAGTTILIAEDEEISRELLKNLLEDEGANVTVAVNGKRALELFRSSPVGYFDAVLMDLGMPVMDGCEAASEIRNTDSVYARTVPIIAVTSSRFQDDIIASMKAGMNHYLTKPVTMQDLSRVLIGSMKDKSDMLLESLNKALANANKDVLTGVKNMTAYTEMVGRLTEEMAADPDMKFAVVECDINDLKQVNDNYGHAAGDIYIKNCCSMICSVFKHSPVFRIGGDEFVVILRNNDYDERDALMETLRFRESEAKSRSVSGGMASFACGIAEYSRELDDSVSTVLRRADSSMYNRKRLMKKGRPVR